MDRDINLAEKLCSEFREEFYPDTPEPLEELRGRVLEYWVTMLKVAEEVLNGQR